MVKVPYGRYFSRNMPYNCVFPPISFKTATDSTLCEFPFHIGRVILCHELNFPKYLCRHEIHKSQNLSIRQTLSCQNVESENSPNFNDIKVSQYTVNHNGSYFNLYWFSVLISLLPFPILYSANFGGENFGKFGETNVICQYFTQPNSRFTKVANVSYCKFANIFLAKTLKQSIHQSFTPPTFCIIQYHKTRNLTDQGQIAKSHEAK